MKRLLNTKWTMQKKLIVYMIILALIIIFALFAGIMVIGRFDSAEKNIQNSLDFQMEAFEKDMSDYFNSLTFPATSAISLSRTARSAEQTSRTSPIILKKSNRCSPCCLVSSAKSCNTTTVPAFL